MTTSPKDGWKKVLHVNGGSDDVSGHGIVGPVFVWWRCICPCQPATDKIVASCSRPSIRGFSGPGLLPSSPFDPSSANGSFKHTCKTSIRRLSADFSSPDPLPSPSNTPAREWKLVYDTNHFSFCRSFATSTTLVLFTTPTVETGGSSTMLRKLQRGELL